MSKETPSVGRDTDNTQSEKMITVVRSNREIKNRAAELNIETRGRIGSELQGVQNIALLRIEELKTTQSQWLKKQEAWLVRAYDDISLGEVEHEYQSGLTSYIALVYKTLKQFSPGEMKEFVEGTTIDFFIRAFTFDFLLSLRSSSRSTRSFGSAEKALAHLSCRQNPRILITLRNTFPKDAFPEVNEKMILHAVVSNPRNPKKAIEETLALMRTLDTQYPKNKFVHVERWMIKYFATNSPKNAAQKLGSALAYIDDLHAIFSLNEYPSIDEITIARLAVYSPKIAHDILSFVKDGMASLRTLYPQMPEAEMKKILLNQKQGIHALKKISRMYDDT